MDARGNQNGFPARRGEKAMKNRTDSEANPMTVEELRFLRYRREVVLQMPAGAEREELLLAINSRMFRLEHEPLPQAA